MRIGVKIGGVLLLFLASATLFGQRQMSKDEILNSWTALQTPTNKDSLFRFHIHSQTRATFDKLLMNGVDTLVVYSVRYPGSSEMNSDSCSTTYPTYSYFFWRQEGKYFVIKVDGKCEGEQIKTNDKVVEFVSANYSKMAEEFFMAVIYGGIADGDKFRISGSAIDHEPKYEILLQIGDKFKHLNFDKSELTDKKSLFYRHNHKLTSYKVFRLIKAQTKKS